MVYNTMLLEMRKARKEIGENSDTYRRLSDTRVVDIGGEQGRCKWVAVANVGSQEGRLPFVSVIPE